MIAFIFQFATTNDPFGSQVSQGGGLEFSGFDISFLLQPLIIIPVVVFVLLIIGINILLYILRHYASIPVAFQRDILLIQVPKNNPNSKGDNDMNLQQIQEAIGFMDTFMNSVAALRAQRGIKYWIWGRNDQVSFELVTENDLIKFYLVIPRYLRQTVEQQLLAQFTHAFIEDVTDYNIFSPKGFIETSSVVFKRPFFFPIKTYKKIEADPLNALTNVLSKVEKEDGVAIQFITRSAKGSWHAMGPKIASKMQQGKSYKDAYKSINANLFTNVMWEIYSMIQGAFTSEYNKAGDQDKPYSLSPMEQEMIKGFEEKTSKAGLDVNIRVITSSSTQFKAKEYLDTIMSAFGQCNIYEYGNSFQVKSVKKKDRFIKDFIYRNFDDKNKILLNTEEFATLYHLPLPSLDTPKILWLLAKKAPPPINLPEEGVELGDNIYRGVKRRVRIQRQDRRRHIYVIGQTGVGKTQIMENICEQDIANGDGVCVVDPHGDMVEYMLERVPKERMKDVIVFDPVDSERPMALNLLEFETEEEKTFVVNETLAIFDKLYDLKATGGPMFEQYMRNALLLIMSDPESGSTLLEIPRVLADEQFRKYKLTKCKNISVVDFWTKEAEKAGGEASLANMVPYITSKLTPFIANDILRPIISQQKSVIDFKDVMNNQKILLLNLSKGKIGEMNSNLLGMVVIGKILLAALGRVNIPEDERKDFYLYIDEFQNFITDSIEVILSEARKYRLCLNMAHQYISQLSKGQDTGVRDAIFGNVGTRVAYRIGIDDAEIISKQFAPVFNEFDVINTPKYTAYCKLMINNENPPAFNLHPWGPTPSNKEIAGKIKQLSRLVYGRDRRIIDAEILERVKKSEQMAEFL